MKSNNDSVFAAGEAFTAKELFLKAAAHTKITLYEPVGSQLREASTVFATYPLDQPTLKFLKGQGVVWKEMPKSRDFVLEDTITTDRYFFRSDDERSISLRAELTI
jgi:hypothetical protein